MEYQFDTETEQIFSSLTKYASDKNPVYLVGGIVRDILLNYPIHDIDIAYCGDVKEYSKKVADNLGAKFFMLNEEFQTARIIYTTQSKKRRWIDIIAVRENNINRDLFLRDFTVNAIAIDLYNRKKIIDPNGGAKDLKNRILRVTNPNSIVDDPVRILRAIRLSVQFGWKMANETIIAIRENSKLLSQVTRERKRDEIFKILNLPNPATALRLMEHLNLLESSFPDFVTYSERNESDQLHFENQIKLVEKFVEFENLIIKREKNKIAMNIYQAELLMSFGGFRPQLCDYFQKTIHQDRNLRSLFIFCILCVTENLNNPDGPTALKSIQKEWVFTKSEMNWINSFWKYMATIENRINNIQPLSPIIAHQFFDSSKISGIAICVYTILESLLQGINSKQEKNWKNNFSVCKYLMDAYFNHYDQWINPEIGINGHEIKRILKINDGKVIGEILSDLTLKIVNGELKERQDVIDYLKSNYKDVK
ncbi:MAG TPA: hypothetical protein VK856_13840 [Anaerolineaceae bacterium]|nr:hypothetical protein [Anaerolineaceae bacterium]